MKNLKFKFYFIYLLIIGVCQTQTPLEETSTDMTFEYDDNQTTTYTIEIFTTIDDITTHPQDSSSTATLNANTTVSSVSVISNTMEMETTMENLETSQAYVTTMASTTMHTTSSISTTTTVYSPDTCNTTLQVALDNGTCVANSDGQTIASNILNNSTANSTTLADALILYIQSIVNVNGTSSNTVSPTTIDNVVSNLSGVIPLRNTNSSFLVVQPVNPNANISILGASFKRGIGGKNYSAENIYNNITNSDPTVAAIVTDRSTNAISLNMLIIDKPTMYVNIDNSTDNRSLVSSVIVAAVKRNSSTSAISNISLYFTILDEYQSNIDSTYFCSFYDTKNSIWNITGCSLPQYNNTYNRYECSCDHLTTFALIRIPKILQSNYLTAQEIASLVCLSFSILCFILALIYIFIMRLCNPNMFAEIHNLFPLISSASTTILFIFYIALTMTVYTRMPYLSSSGIPCFTSSSVLMFFVYFFLIFMFCVKTSMTFYNYLRFIRLFPERSYGTLIILLLLSFFMAIAWTSFAAGFNSNSSFSITQLQGNQLCWFTQDVVYYFVLIPVGVFILLSFLIMILIVKHIIYHSQRATSPHQSYERIKLCVLVLSISSIIQGIAWLFGPYISFVHVGAANVLGWFFVVFNGLEGVWTILLCIIIYFQQRDEQMRTSTYRDSTTKSVDEVERSNVVRDIF